MKRFIILAFIIVLGAAGIYGVSALTGEESFFQPPAVAAIAEQVSEETVEIITDPLEISFSHTDTFYSDNIDVELASKDPEAVIYYSLDGSDPGEDSTEYKGAITVKATSDVRATTIKAVAVKNGEHSGITIKSYVIGKNVFERFDAETLVFVLSTDPYNLYDYYYGVTIEGYLRDEYKKSDEYKGGNIDPPAPANYNMRGMEGEREFFVEVYDNTGKKLVGQAAGARVAGAWSRAASQKSWRLIARNSYSEGNGMFKYGFFPDAVNNIGMPITKYDRLTLRNGGNDRDQAAIRDELTQELARQAGFLDTQEARPAAIFLNGQYYGFSWLKEAYCESYLEQTYGGVKENYRIVQNIEDGDGGEETALAEYQYMYGLAWEAVESGDDSRSFANDEVFNEFCSLVDLDNLMLYYVIQAYIDNKDWPNNNFKAWKYCASDGEEVTNPYNDGKWRFLMFDVEFGWGLYGNGYSENTISNLLTGRNHMGGPSTIMKALFQREDMREMYANTMCDILSGAFNADNILETLDELAAECENELKYAAENGYISGWVNLWTISGNRYQIMDFANNRDYIVYRSMRSVFEIPKEEELYSIRLTNAEGAESRLNSRVLKNAGDIAETKYFSRFGVEIKAEMYTGYEFDHWEVNGEPCYERDLRITSDMDKTGTGVEVQLYTKRMIGEEPLYIRELYTGGGSDWVELYNPNTVAVSTKEYYMSDDETLLNRWKMPTVTIPPESSLIITMKNNKSADSLRKLQTNFSLKVGETLFLSDMNGKIICSAEVVDMLETQSLKRFSNGEYRIVNSNG